jgi:hypothetical protein
VKQNRRIFLQCLFGFCLGGLLRRPAFSGRTVYRTQSDDSLKNMLRGSWKLQSYTYTSNKKSYKAPKEIEAKANFTDAQYDVKFSTHISRAGIKRTRRASESGPYSVEGNRIRLFAEKASEEKEKGEEFLKDVRIEGDTMNLTSNNGANHEVWKRVQESEIYC